MSSRHFSRRNLLISPFSLSPVCQDAAPTMESDSFAPLKARRKSSTQLFSRAFFVTACGVIDAGGDSVARGSAHGLMAFGLKVARARPVSAEHAIKLSRRCVGCKLQIGWRRSLAAPIWPQIDLRSWLVAAAIFHWRLRLLQPARVYAALTGLIHVKKHTPHQSLPCDLLRTRFAESTHSHCQRERLERVCRQLF